MIGRLTGNLVLIEGNQLLLDVSGVGYEVEVSASVLATSPQAGKSLALYTHFVVREEAQLLFGFCLLYTSPSPRDVEESRMPSSA